MIANQLHVAMLSLVLRHTLCPMTSAGARYIYIYIYIYREREREREIEIGERERERERALLGTTVHNGGSRGSILHGEDFPRTLMRGSPVPLSPFATARRH
jgi:hypothetical protein